MKSQRLLSVDIVLMTPSELIMPTCPLGSHDKLLRNIPVIRPHAHSGNLPSKAQAHEMLDVLTLGPSGGLQTALTVSLLGRHGLWLEA